MKFSFAHALNEHPTLRSFLAKVGFLVPFNLVAAAVITHVMGIGENFLENLVFSLCISGIAFIGIDGGGHLIRRGDRPYGAGYWLFVALAAPASVVLGSALATAILDLPPQNVIDNQIRHFKPILIFTLLAASFVIWFFFNRARLAELAARAEAEKARSASIERQAMQTQLQLLQTQIEPHMLFNTLANLQGLIAIDPPRAQHMLDQLIRYLRATLSSSRAVQTTLDKEFALMEAYLGLMSVRLGKRLSYTLTLESGLEHAVVPPMLLQPLVENAIRHGIEPKIDGGRVDVSAERDGRHVKLAVVDTGIGLAETVGDTAGTSLGLANVRERLQALYGDDASLSLTPNVPAGAIARLTIPV